MASETYTVFYKPKGVTELLGSGTGSFIGIVDKTTALNFPQPPATTEHLRLSTLKRKSLQRLDLTSILFVTKAREMTEFYLNVHCTDPQPNVPKIPQRQGNRNSRGHVKPRKLSAQHTRPVSTTAI